MEELNREQKNKIKLDYLLQIRALADNLALATSPDDSIEILHRIVEEQHERKRGEASEDFQDAAQSLGTIIATCQGCQRTHFATWETGDYSEGQLEHILGLMKNDPDMFVQHANESSITVACIAGLDLVVNCDCGVMRSYERLFWNHRWVIQAFFQERARRLEHAANDASHIAMEVSKSLESKG